MLGKEVRKTDCCCNGSAPSNLGLLVGSGLDFRLGFRQLGNRKQLKTENVRWACLKQPRQDVSRKPHWIWEQGTFYLKSYHIITLFFLWKVWHYFPVKKRKPDTLEKTRKCQNIRRWDLPLSLCWPDQVRFQLTNPFSLACVGWTSGRWFGSSSSSAVPSSSSTSLHSLVWSVDSKKEIIGIFSYFSGAFRSKGSPSAKSSYSLP